MGADVQGEIHLAFTDDPVDGPAAGLGRALSAGVVEQIVVARLVVPEECVETGVRRRASLGDVAHLQKQTKFSIYVIIHFIIQSKNQSKLAENRMENNTEHQSKIAIRRDNHIPLAQGVRAVSHVCASRRAQNQSKISRKSVENQQLNRTPQQRREQRRVAQALIGVVRGHLIKAHLRK